MQASARKVRLAEFRASQEAKANVMAVLEEGRLSYGPMSRAFESQFSADHDCKYGVLMNSGTSALHVALQALKILNRWKDGSYVIVPATTFVATANVVLHNGLQPLFVDVDPVTYTLDPGKVEQVLEDHGFARVVVAMIPVHLGGLPADMKALNAIAKKHGLEVIEDSCEAMYSTQDGKKVGSMGRVGCFSTYMAHIITTGVGGICTTNSKRLATLMRSLMNHGRDSAYQDIDQPGEPKNRFKFHHVGHSFRVTEMEAGLGLAQLHTIHKEIEERKKIALTLNIELGAYSQYLQLPRVPSDRTHSFMFYPIVCKDGRKEELVAHLEGHGIETRDLLPLVGQPVYEGEIRLHDMAKDFNPVASNLVENAFYIGCHPQMTAEDIQYVSEVFGGFYE